MDENSVCNEVSCKQIALHTDLPNIVFGLFCPVMLAFWVELTFASRPAAHRDAC